MSVALCAASFWAARSNAWTDDAYQNNVTALSGTTERTRNAMIRRVRSDMSLLFRAVYSLCGLTRGARIVKRSMTIVLAVSAWFVVFTAGGMAQTEKQTERLKNAATALQEILGMPDSLPKDLLDRAEC